MLNIPHTIQAMGGSSNRISLELRAALLLLLFRLPSTVAQPTISNSQPTPVLELRQDAPTNGGFQPISTDVPQDTGDDDTVTNDDTMTNDDGHVFNYYFLLLAIFIAILLLGFVFAGRRRKRKTQQMIRSRQQALRRDLEGFPGRPRPSRNNTAGPWAIRRVGGVTRHDEGLDELGEAPPPYNPGDKPPSIVVDRRANQSSDREVSNDNEGVALAVPLRTLSRTNTGNPPGYLESLSNNGSEDSAPPIARPDAAVTPTADRVESSRRLLDRTQDSSH